MANITANHAFESGRADTQRSLAWVGGGAPAQRERSTTRGNIVSANAWWLLATKVVSGGVEFLYLGLSELKTAENYPCWTACFKK